MRQLLARHSHHLRAPWSTPRVPDGRVTWSLRGGSAGRVRRWSRPRAADARIVPVASWGSGRNRDTLSWDHWRAARDRRCWHRTGVSRAPPQRRACRSREPRARSADELRPVCALLPGGSAQRHQGCRVPDRQGGGPRELRAAPRRGAADQRPARVGDDLLRLVQPALRLLPELGAQPARGWVGGPGGGPPRDDARAPGDGMPQREPRAPESVGAGRRAVREMHRQVGDLVLDEHGVAVRGLLVRHLVLPGDIAGTDQVLAWIASEVSPATYVNLMAQYRPCYRAWEHQTLDRRVTLPA